MGDTAGTKKKEDEKLVEAAVKLKEEARAVEEEARIKSAEDARSVF
jgi:hypothetical protein